MATISLVSGPLALWKNGAPTNAPPSTLSYDQELQMFKLIDGTGRIWMTFQPGQVTSITSRTTGLAFKSQLFTVGVKFTSGDEYAIVYKSMKQPQVDAARRWFEYAANKDAAMAEVVTLMTTREKVSLGEVSSALARHGLPADEKETRKMVEYCIASRKIEGVIDDDQFVSKYALNREQVHYEIVSKFEVSKEGAVVLKCPNCGASIPVQGKEPTGVCEYCRTTYTVPRNILKLI